MNGLGCAMVMNGWIQIVLILMHGLRSHLYWKKTLLIAENKKAGTTGVFEESTKPFQSDQHLRFVLPICHKIGKWIRKSSATEEISPLFATENWEGS